MSPASPFETIALVDFARSSVDLVDVCRAVLALTSTVLRKVALVGGHTAGGAGLLELKFEDYLSYEMKEVWLRFMHSFHTVQVGMSQQVPVAHVALGNNRHVEGSQQGLSQLSRKPQSHSSPYKKIVF